MIVIDAKNNSMTEKDVIFFIAFLDSKNNFRETRKEFSTYGKAKQWGATNIENFNQDQIKINYI